MMMQFSDGEIRRRYKQADTAYEKRKQIRILAELNGCPRSKILDILGLNNPRDGDRAIVSGKRTTKGKYDNYWPKVDADLDAGMSVKDAAKKYGIGQTTIRNHRAKILKSKGD